MSVKTSDTKKSYNKAYHEANRDKAKARAEACRLASPDKKRATDKAYYEANADKRRAYTKAYYEANPDKALAYAKAYREANKDKIKADIKAWSIANPEKRRSHKATRRARTRNAVGSHTAADIRKLFVEQSGRCAYCSITLPRGYHVDHVVPLSRGGENGPDNLRLTCSPCNLRKGARLLSEMQRRDGSYRAHSADMSSSMASNG